MSSDSLQGFEPSEEQKVEESKYTVPQEVYLDHGPPLPDKYGVDKIRLLIQDPNTIVAQWELTGGARERIVAGGNPDRPSKIPSGVEGQFKLRLTDITRNQSLVQDIDPFADNWWFKAEPDTDYRIEIGISLGANNYWIARSNIAHTPRNTVSDVVDAEWMLLGDKFRRLLEAGSFDERRYLASQLGASLGAVSSGMLSEALFSGALLSGQNIYGSLSVMAFGTGETR